MAYTLIYDYNNRREYFPYNSLWAANLVAIAVVRNGCPNVYIQDNKTGEIVKHYTKE